MKKDYGKIAVTNGGIWDEQTPYEKLTTVSRNGQGYLSFVDNQGIDPEQDCDPITGIGTKWFRIATKGDPGTTDYNELINKPFIPTALSDLTDDTTHRTVTDVEKNTWNDKTDKVSNATNGNFAGLDGNGNLTDSGKKASDFATAAQGALAEAAYQKPLNGIPASDIANGVIPDVSQFITKSVNDLVNYYTKSETYTQSEVNALIGSIQQFHYEIYASLQDITTPATNVLYLIGPTGSGSDKYEEHVYANSDFQKIGDTSIDLSNYVTTQALNTALANYVTSTDLTTLLSAKQDTLDSGTNIKTINGQNILGAGNLDVKDVFIAEYGVTTYQEIKDAVDGGKFVICHNVKDDLNFYYQFGGYQLGGLAVVFYRLVDFDLYSISVTIGNIWSSDDVKKTLEIVDNKVTNLNSPNNTKYPTTRAVADYVSGIVGDINSILDTI